MSRPSEPRAPRVARRPARRARRALTAVAAGAAFGGGIGAAGAQPPVRADTVVRDTTAARDTAAVREATAAARDTVVRRAGFMELLSLDRLRLVSVGATMGQAWPAQARPAQLYSVHSDYGEIARGVRLVFLASYWGTYYTDAVVRDLERALDAAGGGTAPVRLGRIRLSNVSLGAEARWRLGRSRRVASPRTAVRPWVGGGLAFHFLDAEGAAIEATFVEGALDAVTAGLAGAVGADIFLLPNLSLTMQARYDLFGGARHGSLRAGASYAFEPAGAR